MARVSRSLCRAGTRRCVPSKIALQQSSGVQRTQSNHYKSPPLPHIHTHTHTHTHDQHARACEGCGRESGTCVSVGVPARSASTCLTRACTLHSLPRQSRAARPPIEHCTAWTPSAFIAGRGIRESAFQLESFARGHTRHYLAPQSQRAHQCCMCACGCPHV